MNTDKQIIKSLLGYLAAAISVIVIASIPGFAFADTGCAGSPISFSFGISAGPVSIGGSCGSSTGGIGQSLCTIVGWFEYGGVGAALASLAVIFMGIAAFFGKVTWGMALILAASIFAIFGAEEIVAAILPSGNGFVTSCSQLSIGISL